MAPFTRGNKKKSQGGKSDERLSNGEGSLHMCEEIGARAW